MGFSGTYLRTGDDWSDHDPDDVPPPAAEPWLLVDIYDSDIATVSYGPAGPGSGVAYLGDTPRAYFDDPDASAPTDVTREAAGLAHWWARQHPAAGAPQRAAKQAEIATYLAADRDRGDDDWDDAVDDAAAADVFVETRTARLLTALGLPVPDELPL
ncbi:hypothetical protein [Jidongwangia harbinensis]|uniref:hypothetical protein n=1 Tax=Jidongwangia harbinensis TaxID=2878561 RepID=UPI001CD9A618|nr:hypothetical protein [Jidongwangia harbinensis]MCA2214955.1 hypothetical protein [Jidongwangia harbinensis]